MALDDVRRRAAEIEQEQRLLASRELARLQAVSAACAPSAPDAVSLALLGAEARYAQREVVALQGELLQETVLADELQASLWAQ